MLGGGEVPLVRWIDPEASTIDKLKQAFQGVRKHWKEGNWWKREFLTRVLGLYYGIKGNNGIYVVDEDWDNLVILDACRYDVLREVMVKDIDYKISRGANTAEWVRENFTGRKCNDIVYVSANPWVDKIARKSFYRIVPVWKDGWDDSLGTVPPKTTTEYAKKAAKQYANKRLIIHYMQPHAPSVVKDSSQNDPLKDFQKGVHDPLIVRDAHKRNLEAALPHIFELLGELKGKTVVSADHGELFGKKILFFTLVAHHWGIRVPELVKVPWVVFEGEERKEIRKEEKPEKRKIKAKIKKLKDSGAI